MIKKLLIGAIALLTLGSVLSEEKGNVHLCKKGTDCAGLTPPAYGCLTVPYGLSKCFYYQVFTDKKTKKINYYFEN